jgi:hypothetical protein
MLLQKLRKNDNKRETEGKMKAAATLCIKLDSKI